MAQYMVIVARADARVADDVSQLYAKEDALPLPQREPSRRRFVVGMARIRRLIGLSPA